jgi:hypothetical protein
MSAYKTQQHHVVHRGRSFHFVSYEGHPEDVKKQAAAQPPTWYLMLAGKRWAVAEQGSAAVPEELDRQFTQWLDENVFAEAPAA